MLIKIIGVGSPFGDDQIGAQAVKLLKQNKSLSSSNLSIEYHDRPGMALISLMQNADVVFIIDAMKSEKLIGTICRLSVDEVIEKKNYFISTHGFGLAQALELAQTLNQCPQEVIFYGIEIGEVALNDNMSSKIKQAIEFLVEQLSQEVRLIM